MNDELDVVAKTAVVIAAYNEARTIQQVVSGLENRCAAVIVVDDGSSDGTGALARAAGALVVRHVINLGQGAALQTGIAYAVLLGASYIVTFDADGQHRADEIEPMVRFLIETGSDVVLGSRFLGRAIDMPPLRARVLRLAVQYTRWTCRLQLSDTHNGFRAMTRSAACKLHIRQDRMAHGSEILEQIASEMLRYREFPVTITYTPQTLEKGQRLSNSVSIIKEQLVGRLTK